MIQLWVHLISLNSLHQLILFILRDCKNSDCGFALQYGGVVYLATKTMTKIVKGWQQDWETTKWAATTNQVVTWHRGGDVVLKRIPHVSSALYWRGSGKDGSANINKRASPTAVTVRASRIKPWLRSWYWLLKTRVSTLFTHVWGYSMYSPSNTSTSFLR